MKKAAHGHTCHKVTFTKDQENKQKIHASVKCWLRWTRMEANYPIYDTCNCAANYIEWRASGYYWKHSFIYKVADHYRRTFQQQTQSWFFVEQTFFERKKIYLITRIYLILKARGLGRMKHDRFLTVGKWILN